MKNFKAKRPTFVSSFVSSFRDPCPATNTIISIITIISIFSSVPLKMSANGSNTGDGARGPYRRSWTKIGDKKQDQSANRKQSRDEESLDDNSSQARPNKRPKIESADVAKYKGLGSFTANGLNIDAFDEITAQYSEMFRRANPGRGDKGAISLSIFSTTSNEMRRRTKLADQLRQEMKAGYGANHGKRQIGEVDEDGLPIVDLGKTVAAPAPPSTDTSGSSGKQAATKTNAPPPQRNRDDRRQGGRGRRGGRGKGAPPKPMSGLKSKSKDSKALEKELEDLDLEMEDYWRGTGNEHDKARLEKGKD